MNHLTKIVHIPIKTTKMQKLNLYIYGIYKSSMKQNKIFLQLVSVLHNTAFPFFFLS